MKEPVKTNNIMKTIYEILATTPHKDTQVLHFKDPHNPEGEWKELTVNEEQIRWLQYHIAIGEFSPKDAYVISNYKICYFKKDGRLLRPVVGNTMSLNDDLAMALLTHQFDNK